MSDLSNELTIFDDDNILNSLPTEQYRGTVVREDKLPSKFIRVVTVCAYLLCVSLAAIMLSMYYIFVWPSTLKPEPLTKQNATAHR